MNKQPEALRLARELELIARYPNVRINQTDPDIQKKAAVELRRLHEVNQELLEVLKYLEEEFGFHADGWPNRRYNVVRAVIAKATGETT